MGGSLNAPERSRPGSTSSSRHSFWFPVCRQGTLSFPGIDMVRPRS